MDVTISSDCIVEQWLQENDSKEMPIPDLEYEPHLLISRVRKHYMEQIIKLLSLNYESNQRLVNKNIYLPSAIWRCAKILEMNAAQNSMLVQLYRRNIITVIKDLKTDTSNGKLYKKLYDCLKSPPQNEKKLQTSLTMGKDCTCTCNCHQRKKVRKPSESPQRIENTINWPNKDIEKCASVINQFEGDLPNTNLSHQGNLFGSQECAADNVMQQLEKLFEGGSNEEDIFDGILCNSMDITFNDTSKKQLNQDDSSNFSRDLIIKEQAAEIKSLDDRLATLSKFEESSIFNTKKETLKNKKISTNKWLCEEYFLKVKLFEILDQLRDCNRAKLTRIKELLIDLFGDDSDDEGVVSPLEETSDFVTSCKERIAPWVVKLLTPYYIKGRIKGKALFKALAKHLIRLIYQCSRYPEEYEVQNFIKDFLQNHKTIRCEADFKQFRIENI